jgi:benzoylformate decarboxylase/acetolactate synthase-1/2/3 large subunit
MGSVRPGWEVTDPDQVPSAGSGGGSAGLGLAMGTVIGATLPFRRSGRFSVHVTGDGELLYTPSSMWTLSNLGLPILTVVNNNHIYGNDEGHQEHIARIRGRNVENKYVGISLDRPATDFAALAKSFGIEGFGPIEDPDDLKDVFEEAVRIVAREQRPVVVDVVTG